jgi:hypothetical protein
MRASTIAAAAAVAAVSAAVCLRSVPACDFCGAVDVSPTMSLRSAEAALSVEITGKKFLFAGDEGAKTAVTFKVVKNLLGEKPAVGASFTTTIPLKNLGTSNKAVVMVAGGEKNPVVLDAYPDPEGRLAEFLVKAASFSKDEPAKIAFFAERLEDPDPWIAMDAQGQFYAIPNEAVHKAASALPAGKLREWIASEKVHVSRKGLYGMLLGLCGNKDDVALLKNLFEAGQDNLLAAGGALAGWARLEGRPGEVLTPVINDGKRPLSARRAALNVVRYLLEKADAKERPGLLDIYRAGLQDKVLAEYAVEEMARSLEFALMEDVQKLWLDPRRSTRNVQLFVRFYGAMMPEGTKGRFMKWLEDNQPPKATE